jgi:hypothetical protein
MILGVQNFVKECGEIFTSPSFPCYWPLELSADPYEAELS